MNLTKNKQKIKKIVQFDEFIKYIQNWNKNMRIIYKARGNEEKIEVKPTFRGDI